MLNNFSLFLQKVDPDIILGHELLSNVLEVYFNRCKSKAVSSLNLGKLKNHKQK